MLTQVAKFGKQSCDPSTHSSTSLTLKKKNNVHKARLLKILAFNYYYNPVHSLSCGFELFNVEPPYASISRKLDQLRHYQSPIQNTQIFSFKDL